MAKGFRYGPGGAGLSFKVSAYTSEDDLLASAPREKTVGIVTEHTITGWCFGSEKPENPSEGEVYIRTAANSQAAFNALKRGTIMVYPDSAKQYVSGEWVEKYGYVFLNGVWLRFKKLTEYLVQNGMIDLEAHAHSATGDKTCTSGYDSSYGTAVYLAQVNGDVVTHSFADVQVPKWATTMYIHYYLLAAYDGYDPIFTLGDTSVTVENDGSNTLNESTVSLDVTELAGGSYTFTVTCRGYSGAGASYIANVWFE